MKVCLILSNAFFASIKMIMIFIFHLINVIDLCIIYTIMLQNYTIYAYSIHYILKYIIQNL